MKRSDQSKLNIVYHFDNIFDLGTKQINGRGPCTIPGQAWNPFHKRGLDIDEGRSLS